MQATGPVGRCPWRTRWRRSGQTVLVVDASVLAVALIDDGSDGVKARARLSGEELSAPWLIDLEVVSVWRGLARGGHLAPGRVDQALADLRAIPVHRVGHTSLLERCWELRANLTVYDAAYVALAELLQVPFLTGDRRLARASGPRCEIEVLDATPR